MTGRGTIGTFAATLLAACGGIESAPPSPTFVRSTTDTFTYETEEGVLQLVPAAYDPRSQCRVLRAFGGEENVALTGCEACDAPGTNVPSPALSKIVRDLSGEPCSCEVSYDENVCSDWTSANDSLPFAWCASKLGEPLQTAEAKIALQIGLGVVDDSALVISSRAATSDADVMIVCFDQTAP